MGISKGWAHQRLSNESKRIIIIIRDGHACQIWLEKENEIKSISFSIIIITTIVVFPFFNHFQTV